MDVTLEQVLVAAKERRAPVTPETAGYIALAVADALLASPAHVREADVRVHDDGTVTIVGAQRGSDGVVAERSVRVLLGKLMQVAAGSAPALAASARNHGGAGVEALVGELEAAMVPVNRSAAKRAIARLAREASRAPEPAAAPQPVPEPRRSDPRLAPVAPQRPPPQPPAAAPKVPAPARPAPAAPAPVAGTVLEAASEPDFAHPPQPPSASLAAAAPDAIVPEPTEVDAPVATRGPDTPPPPTPETPPSLPRDIPPDKLGMTPRLATYDPNASLAAPPPVVAAMPPPPPGSPQEPSRPLVIPAPAFGEVVEADIPTPSVAIDVEAGVGSDASEAQVVDVPSLDVPPISAPPEPAALDTVSRDEGAGASKVAPQPSAPEPQASAHGAGPDRVGELLETFARPSERSSKDVAGELKQMLGLPPTPPPPQVDELEHETPGTAAARLVGSEDSESDPMKPVEFARPRAPRSSFAIVVVLLILALGALAAVWYFYPQVFVGH